MSTNSEARKGQRRWVVLGLLLVALLAIPFLVPPGIAAQGGSISGTVTDPDGLLPPVGTVVRLLKPDHSVFGKADADPGDGSFNLAGIPNGNYILRAVPPETSDLTKSEPVPVSVLGVPVNVGAIPLTEPTILGAVYAPDGSTPAPAWVHVHSAGRWWEIVPTNDGNIQIGGLPAGTYGVQAWPTEDEPWWASQRKAVNVTPGVSQTISLTLTTADVFGRAVDSVGNPVKDAIARVKDTGGSVVSRDVTSRSGHFAIGGLRPGSYRLTLEPPWWQAGLIPPDPVPFTVPPQQNLGVIAFEASHKVVHGTVETNTSTPVVRARVDAQRLDKHGHVHTLSGASGDYRIHLSEGLWALTVEPISTTLPANWLYPFGPQLVHFQHDKSDEIKRVDFRVLTADSNVVGRVEMPNGSVPTFTVTVGIRTDAGIGRHQQIDAGDGSFDIPVPHGPYKVGVVAAHVDYMGPAVDPIRVSPNSTYNLGVLTLQERNATISGVVACGGDPVAEIPVVAWRSHAPGGADALTGPDGGYVLPVVEGTWLVKPSPGPDQPWLYAGEPQEVEVPDGGAIGGVDLYLMATDAEITGILVDEEGTALADVQGWVQAVHKDDAAIQKGAPVEDGAFTILVLAGTYRVSLKLPAGTPWLSAPERDVIAPPGGTANVELVLRAKDAAIAGALWDPRAEATVTGVNAQVTGFSEGAWVRTAVNPGNGAYRLGVAPGVWALGYRVDPMSDYVALRHRRNYPVASGQTVPAPLPVALKDGLIAGIVLDPEGAPLPGVTVVADGLGAPLGDVSLRTTTREDGRFHLRLPHGHYRVRATGEPQEGWIHPLGRNVPVPEGGSVTGLVFQFLQHDATLDGTVMLASSAVASASDQLHSGTVRLWAYSEHDGYIHGRAELGGVYALDVLSDTTWTVGAAYQEGQSYWVARARVRVPPGGATQNLELEGPFPLPAPMTVRFDAAEAQYVELADGTGIYIPAGAMPVSGTVTLHITPIATFPHQRHANVYRYGYAFTAADSHGQPIEQRFTQDVLITFTYDDAELRRMGLSEHWLKPAYFSTTTDSWTFPESYVVDTVANRVAMEIDHFTDFALTTPTVFQVFLPLVVR
jgi:hypothetical protein